MQLHVREEERGVVNSVEYSLMNVFSLMSYALGIIARYITRLEFGYYCQYKKNSIFFKAFGAHHIVLIIVTLKIMSIWC